jgi:thymidylate synthase (FAD)
MSVKLIRVTPDYAKVIEYASRMSTNTLSSHSGINELDPVEDKVEIELITKEANKRSEKFVSKIVKAGHLSLGRFVIAEFEVICSRSALAQWTRHKFLDFCVLSQRYVNQKAIGFILPQLDYIDNDNRKIILHKMKAEINRTKEFYEELLDFGVRKEDARFILPEAMETKFCVVSNLQGWTDFLLLRLDKHAQWEIRKQAEEIKAILLKECPAWFEEIFREELL